MGIDSGGIGKRDDDGDDNDDNNPFPYKGMKIFDCRIRAVRSCVRVEVAVRGSPSLTVLTVSVGVKQHKKKKTFDAVYFRVQELCESRGGRPGLPVLMSLFKPVLNWANVSSPNILRTLRRTMIRFLIELLVRRIWFGQSKLYFILNWLVTRCKHRPELAADAQQTARSKM